MKAASVDSAIVFVFSVQERMALAQGLPGPGLHGRQDCEGHGTAVPGALRHLPVLRPAILLPPAVHSAGHPTQQPGTAFL